MATRSRSGLSVAVEEPLSARAFFPPVLEMPALREAARYCQGCPLYRNATQTVFGEGPEDARVVMVGEVPGDVEDRNGHPFTGPAGRILDRAMADAGLDRRFVYMTNAVKHFKFEERGKRRIHKKPTGMEIAACKPWLEAELDLVHPDLIVCLGATAAQALMGRAFRVTEQRGKFLAYPGAKYLFATVHPSALLRVQDEAQRKPEYNRFVADLRLVSKKLAKG